MREFELITKYLQPLTKNHPASLHLSDDAAVITPQSNAQLAVSCDTIVENIHFLPDTSPDNIAKKLVGVNLSDIASMGAVPKFTLISAVLPRNLPESWFENFCRTLNRLNKKYGLCLIGGDTCFNDGPLTLNMTILGQLDKFKAATRNGASAGDYVYTSGNIGDAAVGLLVAKENKFNLEREKKVYFLEKYNSPTPRVELGKKLSGNVSAMTDVSDGFVRDMENIAKCSKVAIEINADKIPYSKYLKEIMKEEDLTELALTGGDDYELIFTAPQVFHNKLMALAKEVDTKITQIGTVKSGSGVTILDKHHKTLKFKNTGYQH